MLYLRVLGYLLGAIVAHGLLMRLPLRASSVGRFLLAGGSGGLALLGTVDLTAVDGWAAVSVYAFGCELYLFLFTLILSSVSVRTLLLLQAGNLSRADLASLEDGRVMVQRRLGRMTAVGLLVVDRNAYRVTAKGRRLVAVFRILRQFLRPEHTLPRIASSDRFRSIDTLSRINL